MTLQEFKAWFEGFTEDMAAAPNKKQWERIKKRVKEINGTVTTYPVYVDRYWLRSQPNLFWTGIGSGVGICSTLAQGCNGPITSGNVNVKDDGHHVFNSQQAMLQLGKADYQSIA